MCRRPYLIAIVLVFGCSSIVNVIPPASLTNSAITETKVRINMHLQKNAELPATLDVLPKRQGYANRTTDGWNRPLIYTINSHGFTLTSLGKDGAVGGRGDDADSIQSYKLVNGHAEEI